MVPELWGEPLWEIFWPYLDPWDSVRLRAASSHWNVPGKYGPHGELFLLHKEGAGGGIKPYVSAVTLEACALIGLHLLAADYEVGSSGSETPNLGDMWKYGFPKRTDLEQPVFGKCHLW